MFAVGSTILPLEQKVFLLVPHGSKFQKILFALFVALAKTNSRRASPKLVCSMNVHSGHSIGLAPFTPEGKDFCAVPSPLHLGQGLGVGQQKITRPHLVIF